MDVNQIAQFLFVIRVATVTTVELSGGRFAAIKTALAAVTKQCRASWAFPYWVDPFLPAV